LQTLIDEQQRLYRLLDSGMNGQIYTVTGIDPQTNRPIIAPERPDVPAQLTHPALRPLLNRAYNAPLAEDWPDDTPGMLEVLRNFQGTINAGWFGLGGEKATIANVVEALRVGNAQTREDIWDKLQAILLAGSSGANIVSLLADFFTDAVDAGLEGGILAMQIASTMATVAAQIRIIQALDGGAITAPTNETRNAVSLLESVRNKLIEADPDADSLLEEIRKLLV
jgi:hypothetical protein